MADRSRRRPFDFLRRRPDAVAADIEEELTGHLEMRTEELRARGLPADEARREALRQFGDLDGTRRYCKGQNEQKETHMQRLLWLDDLSQDIRISARGLVRRSPVLALTIILTVGLGIGATTAIFAAVNAALLRPLPYRDADRLVRIYTDNPPFRFRFSIADYLALREQQTQFEQTATYTDRALTYSDASAAELVRARVVSSGYLSLLGLAPALGRDFQESDERPGSPIVVIASQGFWERRLGRRPDAVGSMIRLDGADYALVGVLPRQTGPLEQGFDLFMIQQFAPPPRRGPFFYTVIARLKPGVDASVAETEARAINKRIFPIWKASYQDEKATWSLIDLKSHIVGDVSRIAGVAARGGGDRLAHRLCERVEPAGRPGDEPAARARGAHGPGRVARPRHPSSARREFHIWRPARCWSASRSRGSVSDSSATSGPASFLVCRKSRWAARRRGCSWD